MVVIGFNSTTLLEGRLYRRPTIIPVFAEASGAYRGRVYFKDDADIFMLAESKEDLKAKVLRCVLNGFVEQPPMPDEKTEQYLGYFDGQALERIAGLLTAEVARATAEH